MFSRAHVPLLTLLLISAVPPTLEAGSCSCTAPDNSCQTSITCRGGCISACATGGGCYSDCVRELYGAGAAAVPMTLRGEGVRAEDISQALSTATKASIEFQPLAKGTISLDVHDAPPSEVMRLLAKFGTYRVVGWSQDVALALVPADQLQRPLNLDAKDLDAATATRVLSKVLGLEVHISARSAETRLSLQLSASSVSQVLERLVEFGVVTLKSSESQATFEAH